MSTGYAIAYRLGITPWERAGRGAAEQFSTLLSREEAERTPPYGPALDLGCGTGAHSLQLAERGWRVIGIDSVSTAVRQARDRARDRGDEVRFIEGDVTELRREEVGEVSFFLDVGCFHGLTGSQRMAMGKGSPPSQPGTPPCCCWPSDPDGARSCLTALVMETSRRPFPAGPSPMRSPPT